MMRCRCALTAPNVERFLQLVGRQFLLLFNDVLASRVGGAADIENNDGNFKIDGWEWENASVGSQIF